MRLSPFLLLLVALPLRADDPDWVAPMKEVHARFKGAPGTLAAFGDSITVTMAFWAPLQGEPKNMPDDMRAAHAVVKEYLKPDCWSRSKVPKYGSVVGMTARWADENVDQWLKALTPEAAVILFGTNDLGGLDR